MKFPLLYSLTKTGKIKQWQIDVVDSVDKSIIIVRHGYENGKVVEVVKEISSGKNLGKANKTTPYSQAILEAQSKWNKKIEEGYTETKENIQIKLLPMLADKYNDYKHHIKFDCYVQPKLDGIRCFFNKGKLYSRTGKEIKNIPVILNQLKKANVDLRLDGEITIPNTTFQQFSGLMNKKYLSEADNLLLKTAKFSVFDYIIENKTFEERYKILSNFFNKNKFENIYLIKTEICKTHECILKKHKEYVKENYEGIIIRNREGLYEINYRSKNLLKYKTFFDEEFKIVGYKEGTSIEKGCVIWICSAKKSGDTFDVRPTGTFEERKILFKNAKKYIGSYLTVKFQEYIQGTDIPRFGVGVAIRNYE